MKGATEEAITELLQKDVLQPVLHDIDISSRDWDSKASSFFRRRGFAKYGRKKGCPRCKDLYEKSSSLHKHSVTCPSITGVQESSTLSDESEGYAAKIVEKTPFRKCPEDVAVPQSRKKVITWRRKKH